MKLTAQNDMRKVVGNSTRYELQNKRRKSRVERRQANKDPEVQPCYKKYAGWVS